MQQSNQQQDNGSRPLVDVNKKAKGEINFYLCGGTGINIGNALRANAHTQNVKNATFIGLDSSGNNAVNVNFPVERMYAAGSNSELTRGSGKNKATNFAQAGDFIDRVVSNHKPNSFNVIVANTSGGTGSVLSLLLLRKLVELDQVTVLCLINDFTSQVEMKNAIGTMRSLANQTTANQLDIAIPYLRFDNTNDKTRGQVNADVVNKLNLLSLFLTENNEEQDFEDIKNFLAYNRHYGVPAALSRIQFFDQDTYVKHAGVPPVAVSSLFSNADEIIPRFEGSVIRSTGVFNPNDHRPTGTEELHMTLDHGEELVELEKQIQLLEDRESQVKQTFVTQKEFKNTGNDLGIIL